MSEVRTTVPVSTEAMRHLDLWVPRQLRESAWRKAFKTYLDRAPTTDGNCRFYATERANRFWPIYLSQPSPYANEPIAARAL